MGQNIFVMTNQRRRRYGFGSFLFDLFMIALTGGLWLIWIFVRELSNR